MEPLIEPTAAEETPSSQLGALLIVVSVVSTILAHLGLNSITAGCLNPIAINGVASGHVTSLMISEMTTIDSKRASFLKLVYIIVFVVAAITTRTLISYSGGETGIGAGVMNQICTGVLGLNKDKMEQFQGWSCFCQDEEKAKLQTYIGLFSVVYLVLGVMICNQTSSRPWDFTKVLNIDIRRAGLSESSVIPKGIKNVFAALTIGATSDFRCLIQFVGFLYISTTLLLNNETLICFLFECVIVQSNGVPNIAIVVVSTILNLVLFYFFIVITARHLRQLAAARYSNMILLDGSDARRLRGIGFLDVLLRGQSCMLEGAVPKDQTASKKSDKKPSQPEDSLVIEQGVTNTNLGPREAFEKAIAGGFVHFLCMTVVGLAYNQSPASLQGLMTGISRATRAKKSQSMKVGVMLMGKLEVATESQTVLPSSNPTVLVRESGWGVATSFQLKPRFRYGGCCPNKLGIRERDNWGRVAQARAFPLIASGPCEHSCGSNLLSKTRTPYANWTIDGTRSGMVRSNFGFPSGNLSMWRPRSSFRVFLRSERQLGLEISTIGGLFWIQTFQRSSSSAC